MGVSFLFFFPNSPNDIRGPRIRGRSIDPETTDTARASRSTWVSFLIFLSLIGMLWVASANCPSSICAYGSKSHWTRFFYVACIIFLFFLCYNSTYLHPGCLFLGRKRKKKKLLASGENSWTDPMIIVLVWSRVCGLPGARSPFLRSSLTKYPRLTGVLLKKFKVQISRQGSKAKAPVTLFIQCNVWIVCWYNG